MIFPILFNRESVYDCLVNIDVEGEMMSARTASFLETEELINIVTSVMNSQESSYTVSGVHRSIIKL